MASAIAAATSAGSPSVGVGWRDWPCTLPSSSTTAAWILVPPRSMPPRMAVMLRGDDACSRPSWCSWRGERPEPSTWWWARAPWSRSPSCWPWATRRWWPTCPTRSAWCRARWPVPWATARSCAGAGARSPSSRVRRSSGGLVGAVLLLVLPEGAFEVVVPVLVALAVILVAVQPAVAKRVGRSRARRAQGPRRPAAVRPDLRHRRLRRLLRRRPGRAAAGDHGPDAQRLAAGAERDQERAGRPGQRRRPRWCSCSRPSPPGRRWA